MIASTLTDRIFSADKTELSAEIKGRNCFTLRQIRFLGMVICISLMQLAARAQQDTLTRRDSLTQRDTLHQQLSSDTLKTNDSSAEKLIQSIRQFGVERERRSNIEYHEDTIATRQDEIVEEIRRITSEAKSYLKTGLDTTGLKTEIREIDNWYKVSGEGVFTHTGSTQTNRNLETSSKIFTELLKRIKKLKFLLDDYHKNLVGFRNRIDSLSREGVLYKFSSDSAVVVRYARKLMVVGQELAPTDSAFNKTLAKISELQTTVNRMVNKMNSSIEQVAVYRKQLFNKANTREVGTIDDAGEDQRPFGEIVSFSRIKEGLALAFYMVNNIGTIFMVVILVLGASVFLRNLKRNLKAKQLLNGNGSEQLIVKHPKLSALVIVLTIFQFVFLDPPFIFNALIWTISGIALTIILRNYISKFWMLAWLAAFVLFLLASADNLILQPSNTERWIMLVLATVGAGFGSWILLHGRRTELREKLITYFIGLVVLMEMVSIIANVYGRYNFSKTLFTNGFFGIVLAMLFLWTVRLINQGLSLATQAYSIPDKKLFYINFDSVGKKAPPVFYVLLIVGWFVLFARNFYAYRFVADPIVNFIREIRSIGNFSFTIQGMLMFFLIIFLAGLVSKVVSFFASDKHRDQSKQAKKGGIGSWLLLIRISIISFGLFLAFAAAGIPMDRVTIILSALSVGIGFGLQTLVNNLVSGLIISFEKPVSVGDVVEIGGQSGTVKSIGFRSSIISTVEGSDVVIPNGDLLNQHLINWTHGNLNRRVDIIVGVAYGTNLENATQILKELPKNDERILSYPAPNVLVRQFASSSIDIQLLFWVRNIGEWTDVKSDVILAIDAAFKENKIEIPFPQQDLHIRSVNAPQSIPVED